MSFIKNVGLQYMILDDKVESGEATWSEYEAYRTSIAGLNIDSDKFWNHLDHLKKVLIRKDPDAYLQHELTKAKRIWPHLDTSYSFDNIMREIEGAEDGNK